MVGRKKDESNRFTPRKSSPAEDSRDRIRSRPQKRVKRSVSSSVPRRSERQEKGLVKGKPNSKQSSGNKRLVPTKRDSKSPARKPDKNAAPRRKNSCMIDDDFDNEARFRSSASSKKPKSETPSSRDSRADRRERRRSQTDNTSEPHITRNRKSPEKKTQKFPEKKSSQILSDLKRKLRSSPIRNQKKSSSDEPTNEINEQHKPSRKTTDDERRRSPRKALTADKKPIKTSSPDEVIYPQKTTISRHSSSSLKERETFHSHSNKAPTNKANKTSRTEVLNKSSYGDSKKKEVTSKEISPANNSMHNKDYPAKKTVDISSRPRTVPIHTEASMKEVEVSTITEDFKETNLSVRKEILKNSPLVLTNESKEKTSVSKVDVLSPAMEKESPRREEINNKSTVNNDEFKDKERRRKELDVSIAKEFFSKEEKESAQVRAVDKSPVNNESSKGKECLRVDVDVLSSASDSSSSSSSLERRITSPLKEVDIFPAESHHKRESSRKELHLFSPGKNSDGKESPRKEVNKLPATVSKDKESSRQDVDISSASLESSKADEAKSRKGLNNNDTSALEVFEADDYLSSGKVQASMLKESEGYHHHHHHSCGEWNNNASIQEESIRIEDNKSMEKSYNENDNIKSFKVKQVNEEATKVIESMECGSMEIDNILARQAAIEGYSSSDDESDEKEEAVIEVKRKIVHNTETVQPVSEYSNSELAKKFSLPSAAEALSRPQQFKTCNTALPSYMVEKESNTKVKTNFLINSASKNNEVDLLSKKQYFVGLPETSWHVPLSMINLNDNNSNNKIVSQNAKKIPIKEKERAKRAKGQSSQVGWKPEEWMKMRQQFD